MNKRKDELINTDGHLDNEGIAVYAENLSQRRVNDLPDVLRTHVEDCAICKMKILGVYKVLNEGKNYAVDPSNDIIPNKSIETIKPIKPADKNKISIVSYLLKIAAVLIILIGGYLSVSYLKNSKTADQVISLNDTLNNNKTSIQKITADNNLKQPEGIVKIKYGPGKTNLLAANFVESKSFEILINSGLRSSSAIEVVKPPNLSTFMLGDQIEFEWKSPLKEIYLVTIYSNKGKEKVKSQPLQSSVYSIKINLLPGLYYWKLENEVELCYVGKFLVK
jgi:hypothetical protein